MTEGTPRESPQGELVNLPIDWQVPTGAQAAYATNFVVQRMQHEYLISFFQIQPPLVLGSPDQVLEHLTRLEKVPARLLSQIIIAESRFPEFLQLIQTAPTLSPATQSPVPTNPQE